MKTPALFACLLTAAPAQDSFSLRWASLDGGGGPSPAAVAAGFSLGGSSVGQWDARTPADEASAFSLTGGFWSFFPDLPTLRLSLEGGMVTLSWDDFGTPAVLETSSDLVLWEAVEPQPVTPAFEEPGGNRKFYRLVRP